MTEKRTLDTELQNPTEQIFPPKHTPYKMTVMGGWEIFLRGIPYIEEMIQFD